MSYYPNKINQYIYNNEAVAFDVGINKDTYSIETRINIDVESNVAVFKSNVCKNWTYNEIPKDGVRVEGKKYREILFKGSVKECYAFIHNIVCAEGYWDYENPNDKIGKEKVLIFPEK